MDPAVVGGKRCLTALDLYLVNNEVLCTSQYVAVRP